MTESLRVELAIAESHARLAQEAIERASQQTDDDKMLMRLTSCASDAELLKNYLGFARTIAQKEAEHVV